MKTAMLAVAFGALAFHQAKPAPADGIIWQGDWEEAVKEAKARNVPIHLTVHKDN